MEKDYQGLEIILVFHFFLKLEPSGRLILIVIETDFSSGGNLFLLQILHSGYRKLIFWLVETVLFQFLIYPFYWK